MSAVPRSVRKCLPVWLAACVLALPAIAGAQAAPEGPADERPRSAIVSDVKAYVVAPLRADRRQWVKFAAAVGAVAFAYGYDDEVREHFEPEGGPRPDNDRHDDVDALPGALMLGATWVAAAGSRDRDGKREAGTMLQAAAFTAASTYALKTIAGRERPDETGEKSDWRERGDSFPSMHSSLAFAIGTVLAESGNDGHRWLRRAIGYGLAARTAYARLDHDAHWLSDTVAGAAVGIATARFVMKRRDGREDSGRFAVMPSRDGLALAYVRPVR